MQAPHDRPHRGADPTFNPRELTHLDQLESEAIQIIRETTLESDNPAMLYSIGKDSSVLMQLALKVIVRLRDALFTRRNDGAPASRERHARSIVKAVSWRISGSLDTFVLAWLITGSTTWAGSIASTEIVTKIVIYYLHERVWSQVAWGRR